MDRQSAFSAPVDVSCRSQEAKVLAVCELSVDLPTIDLLALNVLRGEADECAEGLLEVQYRTLLRQHEEVAARTVHRLESEEGIGISRQETNDSKGEPGVHLGATV